MEPSLELRRPFNPRRDVRNPSGSDPTTQLVALVKAFSGVWWDFRVGVTIGTGVSSWADRIQGKTLSQVTGTKQPSYSGTGGITFDGVDDQLNGPVADTLVTTSTLHNFAVANPISITATDVPKTAYNNPGAIEDVGGVYALTWRNNAGTKLVQQYGYDSVTQGAAAEATCSQNVMQLFEGWMSSNTLSVRAGAGSVQTASMGGAITGLGNTTTVAKSFSTGPVINMTMKALLLFPAALAAAPQASARNLLSAIYGVPA